jgi:hypothetical protein
MQQGKPTMSLSLPPAAPKGLRLTVDGVQKSRFDVGVQWIRRFYNPDDGSKSDPAPSYPGTGQAGWRRIFYPTLDQMWDRVHNTWNDAVVTQYLDILAKYKEEDPEIRVLHSFCAYRADKDIVTHAPTGFAYDSLAYLEWVRDRLAELITKIPAGHLHAFECANEPPEGLTDLSWLAQLSRVFHQQFKTLYSPNIVACSPAFQGGTWPEFHRWLTASAAGVVVRGNDGTGTLGERWMDVIAWHPYGTLDHMSEATAGNHRLASDIAMTAMGGIRLAMEPRLKIDKDSVWFGKAMPPIWATEFNVSGCTLARNDDEFRYQRLNATQRLAAIRYLLLCAFAAGFEKAFLYAVDHMQYTGGASVVAVQRGSSGLFRLTLPPGSAAFTGDRMTIAGSRLAALNGTRNVVNPSTDGTTVELEGAVFFPGDWSGAEAGWSRQQLGGWHAEFQTVLAEIVREPMKAGFVVSTDGNVGPWAQTVQPWVQFGTGPVQLVEPIRA